MKWLKYRSGIDCKTRERQRERKKEKNDCDFIFPLRTTRSCSNRPREKDREKKRNKCYWKIPVIESDPYYWTTLSALSISFVSLNNGIVDGLTAKDDSHSSTFRAMQNHTFCHISFTLHTVIFKFSAIYDRISSVHISLSLASSKPIFFSSLRSLHFLRCK